VYSNKIKVPLALLFFFLPFSNALASYSLLCKISFQSFYTSMDDCEVSANKTGKILYKKIGLDDDTRTLRKVMNCKGLSITEKKEFEEMIASNKVSGDKGLLLVRKHSNGFSGKIITNFFTDAGYDFGIIKKDSTGIAKAAMDNGLTIWLQIEDKARLIFTGEFGTIEMSGPCQTY
jgi:hypothetical protein